MVSAVSMGPLCTCVGLIILQTVLGGDICQLAYEFDIEKLQFLCEQELMSESLLQKRAPNPFIRFGRGLDYYARNRRGPNYIRFGRSAGGDYEDALEAIKRVPGGTFMRFGRSTEDAEHSRSKRDISEAEQKRFMRFGRDKEDQKRFMRFGRNSEEEKRFMRFGRDPEKRFMRFGRSGEEDETTEKRFMRFGRDSENEDEDSLDKGKRFMRFGRGPFMRFGKRGPFMRFGRSDGKEEDKRGPFMRFGKRFMRFGKRFMRFGKRDEDEELTEEKQKKFMRFGKLSDDDASLKDKRFMRFGKKDDTENAQKTSAGSEEKRFMRFGKKSFKNAKAKA